MTDSRVLALVPHHRCERWLDHCLASLVGQTRPPDGIVVIDDASSEPPSAIVRRFPGVTLLRATANVGPYRLVQQVIDETTYDHYLFQDADDWSAPDRLECLLAGAERTGAELIGSDYLMLCTDEVRTVPHTFPLDVNAALAEAPTCHALQHPTSLVSRALVTRLGGYASGMRFSGDDEFLRRAAHVARVVNVPGILYFRRHRAESLTTSAETGHGSPARRDLQLEHLCGPLLDGSEATSARRPTRSSRAARRRRAFGRGRARDDLQPVFIVGGTACGADALLWSLAQHPAVVPVLDVTWLQPLSESVDLVAHPSEVAHTAPSSLRHLRPLDSSAGARPDELRAALAGALRRILLEGPVVLDEAISDRSLEDELRQVAALPARSSTCWVAALAPDPDLIAAALTLFPRAGVVHVVRQADEVALALGRRSMSNPNPLPMAQAYEKWLTEARRGLAVERAVGGERLLRIRLEELTREPAESIKRCLAFAGLYADAACVRPLEQLDLVVEQPPAGSGAAATARELSTALCGPPPQAARADSSSGRPARSPQSEEQRQSARRPSAALLSPPAKATVPAHVARPSALLTRSVPAGAVVALVTKGEGRFLQLDGHQVWHFPQTAGGEWAGYHPASCDEIVRHLDELEQRGARYFLIPSWAMWWLDHYTGLRQHLEQHGRVVAEEAEAGIVFELKRVQRDAAPAPARSRRRRSVSVITWDIAHNPLGRAHVLAELLADRYDVELVGAEFERFGTGVWQPLRDMDVPLRTFTGGDFPEYFARMQAFASNITSDAVVVSKPRLPSYLLGIMAKAFRNRPLVLDVDDRELTFVGATEPLDLAELQRRDGDSALLNPYGSHWTRHCEALVGAADHVTVSNETLQALFGGTIVPHARDERSFDRARFDRDQVRRRFGFSEGERIVLFGGTPRRHKGVVELAGALREVGDPCARLCLIGTSELESLRKELAPYADLIRVVPYQPFSELPALLAAADMVAVLQDPASEVSHYQMPAKITDALAMQLPCLVRRVPPLEPLVAGGHLEAVGDNGLAAKLAEMFTDEGGVADRARANREVFLEGYSFSAVRPRLEAVVEGLLERTPALADEHRRLLDFGVERFGDASPSEDKTAPPDTAVRHRDHRAPRRREQPRRRGDGRFDVVMFWKQNDTGIYGRRHDMLMHHLSSSKRVGQVIQFDAPLHVGDLAKAASEGVPTHRELVRDRTISRIQGTEPSPGLRQHSFLYTSDGCESLLPRKEDYVVHVKEVLARHRVGDRPVVFWVYPKCFEFPEIARALGPDLTVADVVDDHRTWARPGTPGYERIVANYQEIAELSDLTLTNCDAMRTTMAALGGNVHLVPNAAEHPDPSLLAPLEVPAELRDLNGPIIGYVGNLSSRIDVDLLEHLATTRPHFNVVLVGSAHAGRDVLRLRSLGNVSLLGPRPYEEAKRYVRAFDVGIIPHLDDEMTAAMHPLKAFVYCALGVPVVSTDIANLGELRPLISVAADHADFVTKVDAAVDGGSRPLNREGAEEVLRRNSWRARTGAIVELVDEALRERGVLA